MKKEISQLFVYPKAWITEETQQIATAVRQWANKEVVAKRLEYQAPENYANMCRSAREKLAFDIGCQGLMLPEALGGLGLNRLTDAPALISILKEIGRADASIGFVFALEYAGLSLFTMAPHAHQPLCEQLAPLFCGKVLNSVALILPGPGHADAADPLFEGRSISARIRPADGAYVITGENLRPIGGGADAGLFVVVCADGSGRPLIALVPGDAKGVVRSERIKKTGLDGCDNADVGFENVLLAKEYVIDRDRAPHELYARLNLLLAGVSVGACMGSLEIVGAWAEKRVIKGDTLLKDNPLCASVLAEIYEEITVAWLLTHDLANHLANPDEWGESSSPLMFAVAQMLGRRIQEGCLRAINRTMELMASEGYAKEGGVEQTWRDVKTIQSSLCGLGGEAPARLDVAGAIFGSRLF